MIVLVLSAMKCEPESVEHKHHSEQSRITKSFSEHHVVPDVLDFSPASVLDIKYRPGVAGNLGNELKVDDVKEAPEVVWTADVSKFYTLIAIRTRHRVHNLLIGSINIGSWGISREGMSRRGRSSPNTNLRCLRMAPDCTDMCSWCSSNPIAYHSICRILAPLRRPKDHPELNSARNSSHDIISWVLWSQLISSRFKPDRTKVYRMLREIHSNCRRLSRGSF
ncbi:uncharacterized protein LOC129601701 isoform X2 [Paramacrobiotus metropolitanus]|nr:uncharacterized protein LOC129601701 isoform X2 [Paramacrobiotus metropolitanus]XP_055356560.1 uncharacterized protein LOC129601701 isoform X2 [Paramacrobiotus metropolitanus]XP_055356568.1 uncharacterized protein LOC129601701 isoform X2 [Paramacrobiotus metropolitanus]